MGTTEGKIHRWEDNIKEDLREVSSDARKWMDHAKMGTNGGIT